MNNKLDFLNKDKNDKFLFLLITSLFIFIFIFTSDGHRFTFDEDVTQQQTIRLVTLEPHPDFQENESPVFFEYTWLFPPETNNRPVCISAILCTASNIGHSVTEFPFVFINEHFNFFNEKTNELSSDDFADLHYVYWRNNLDPNFMFMELFYGPFFSGISVGLFFLLCRSFDYTNRTSTILALFLGVGTMIWAYSQTSLNAVALTTFLILGFYLFKKFTDYKNTSYLLFSSLSLGFGFLIRPDAIFLISVLLLLLTYKFVKEKYSVKIWFYFIIPTFGSYLISKSIQILRFGFIEKISNVFSGAPVTYPTPFYYGLIGLLFSPGVGLLIFNPILNTIFISFYDFYKKHKVYCISIILLTLTYLFYYSTIEAWHGLNAWGPRYLLPLIPFLLLPLGSSLEKRNKGFLVMVIGLVILGLFFNIVYVINDVSWFVWGFFGDSNGLYGLAREESATLRIHPTVLWTFEYSQLTQSIILTMEKIQHDIFLLHLLGSTSFFTILLSGVSLFSYLIFRNLRKI